VCLKGVRVRVCRGEGEGPRGKGEGGEDVNEEDKEEEGGVHVMVCVGKLTCLCVQFLFSILFRYLTVP